MKIPATVLCLALVSGCASEPDGQQPKSVEAAVQALLNECETQWASNAEARAREVISCGGAALPSLTRMWKKAKDPDAMVWSWACIACIRTGWTLDEYKQRLIQRLATADITKGARDVPYMANAYVLGYAPAFFMLEDVSGHEGASNLKQMDPFSETTPTYDIINHNGKIHLMHAQIKLLGVGDKDVRARVIKRLIAEHDHMTGSYLDDRDRYFPEEPPQTESEKKEIRRLWKEARAYVDEPPNEREKSIVRLRTYCDKFRRATPEEFWKRYLKGDNRSDFRGYRSLYEMKWPTDKE